MPNDTTVSTQLFLPIGTMLGGNRYRITRFIAGGGFGCTYEAVHTLFNARVVIKEFFVKDFCNRGSDNRTMSVAVTSKRELAVKLCKKFIGEAVKLKALDDAHNPPHSARDRPL